MSLTTLMNERAAIGGSFGQMDVSLAMSVAEEVEIDGRPALEDGGPRRTQLVCAGGRSQVHGIPIADCAVSWRLARAGDSISSSSVRPDAGDVLHLMDLLGASGAIADESLAAKAGIIQRAYMGAPGLRIASGWTRSWPILLPNAYWVTPGTSPRQRHPVQRGTYRVTHPA